MVTVDDVLAFTIDGPGTGDEGAARQALDMAEAFVIAHTRGKARTAAGEWREGVGAVVLAVAARILANPSGIAYRDQAGSFSVYRQTAFNGFTLPEQMVLNRYRKKSI